MDYGDAAAIPVGSVAVYDLVSDRSSCGDVWCGSRVQSGLCDEDGVQARVMMLSQSSVVCFPSENTLLSRQLISPEVLASALLVGMCDAAWLTGVASVVSLVMQMKWQFRQEKGPLVVLGKACVQLLFWHPGSRAQRLSTV